MNVSFKYILCNVHVIRRESVAEVVTVEYHPVTGVSLLDLKRKLETYRDRRVKIGSFSAASNVSGISNIKCI